MLELPIDTYKTNRTQRGNEIYKGKQRKGKGEGRGGRGGEGGEGRGGAY